MTSPPKSVELGDDRMEDAADVRRQLLCAALRAELVGQRLGQWREARDVGEERRAMDPVGQDAALEERPSPVTRQVGVGDVDEATDGRCLGRHAATERPATDRRAERELLVPGSRACAHSAGAASPTSRGRQRRCRRSDESGVRTPLQIEHRAGLVGGRDVERKLLEDAADLGDLLGVDRASRPFPR